MLGVRVQIQFNPIKITKSIQSKLKTDQNHKSLDWIGLSFSQTAWIGSDFGFNFQNQSKPNNIIQYKFFIVNFLLFTYNDFNL